MFNKKIIYSAAASLAVMTFVVAGSAVALAAGSNNGWHKGGVMGTRPQNIHARQGTGPALAGTVTGINGTTLTVVSRGFRENTATTTYSVDASNATVIKDNATSTVSSIATGDNVVIKGTVSGANVTATNIRDVAKREAPIQGNGQPVVAGTISSISGSAINITNSSSVSYVIDATNAKIQKNNSDSSISDLTTGDYIVVQGTVDGNSIIAASIIDRGNQSNGNDQNAAVKQNHPGFFISVANFFRHLFGF